MSHTTSVKPLGRKSYGSIGHIPGSRRGPGDHGVHVGQGEICTRKPRDRHDRIIVQEKLDGSNVSVARINGTLYALNRAGWSASSSPYEQHRLFWRWMHEQVDAWDWLPDNHRVCGEWLAQAHSTRYTVTDHPFVAFDVMVGDARLPYDAARALCGDRVRWAHVLSDGPPLPVVDAMALLGPNGFHGAIDLPEGVVYRVERKGEVDFLAKYVRPDKLDGIYLPGTQHCPETAAPVWNWRPEGSA